MASETSKQLGILFGFANLMILSMALYAIVWRAGNKREERKEGERKAGLIERGFGPLNEEVSGGGGKSRGQNGEMFRDT